MAKWSLAIWALSLALLVVGAFVAQMYVPGHDALLGVLQTGGVAGLVVLGFLWHRRVQANDDSADHVLTPNLTGHVAYWGGADRGADGADTPSN